MDEGGDNNTENTNQPNFLTVTKVDSIVEGNMGINVDSSSLIIEEQTFNTLKIRKIKGIANGFSVTATGASSQSMILNAKLSGTFPGDLMDTLVGGTFSIRDKNTKREYMCGIVGISKTGNDVYLQLSGAGSIPRFTDVQIFILW